MWTKSCRLSPGPVGVEGLLDVVAAGVVTTVDTGVVATAVTAVDTVVVAVTVVAVTDTLGVVVENTVFDSLRLTITVDFSAEDHW